MNKKNPYEFEIYNKKFVLDLNNDINKFEVAYNVMLHVFVPFSGPGNMWEIHLNIQIDDGVMIQYKVCGHELNDTASKLQDQLGETWLAIDKFFKEEE